MTTHPSPTGTREVIDGLPYIVFRRTFAAPIDDVWAAVTEPERLARWIGTWQGDPRSGEVTFQMLYEDEDMPAEVFAIEECEPPRTLVITSTIPYDGENTEPWHLRLSLTEADGTTTFTFAQNVPSPEMAEGVGPGWDYYLDRLVAAEAGHDVAAIDFGAYHPAMAPHYKALFPDS